MCNEDALLYPHIGVPRHLKNQTCPSVGPSVGGVQNFKKLPNCTTNKAYTALTPGAPLVFLALLFSHLLYVFSVVCQFIAICVIQYCVIFMILLSTGR